MVLIRVELMRFLAHLLKLIGKKKCSCYPESINVAGYKSLLDEKKKTFAKCYSDILITETFSICRKLLTPKTY